MNPLCNRNSNAARCAAFVLAMVLSLAASTSHSAEPAEKDANENKNSSPTAEQISNWIVQLDDDRYLVRESATQQLIEAGVAALDPLLAAANSKKPEPADRSVWIMGRLARSRDNDQAIAALERLVQLENRPTIVEKAETELDERNIALCQAKLSPLGADLSAETTPFDNFNVVPVLRVRLTEKWRGNSDDLKCIAELRRHEYFRFEGKPVNDDVASFFESKERLAFLQFLDTEVTPAAVDKLKLKHPDAIIYVRGQALLGVQAENHPGGVLVSRVEPGTAAANAGIMAGDIIVSLDGKKLPDFDRLTARIAQHQPGETVEIELLRGTAQKKLPVTFGSWTRQE